MQTLLCYVSAPGTVGTFRDYANAKKLSAPTLVLGVSAQLKLRLWEGENNLTPYPISRFSEIVSWRFDIDSDYDGQTNSKIAADHANITVSTVTENNQQYTEFVIPLPDMNSQELNAWLGTAGSKSGLTGELLGMDCEGNDVFVLQLENFVVRNRVIHTGEPTEPDPAWLDAEQVRALIAAGYVLDSQVADNVLQLRMRSASSASSTWSAWMPFVGIGANGHWYVGGTDTGVPASGAGYSRRTVSAAATAVSGEWLLVSADCTITLPAGTSGAYVRVSSVGEADAVVIAPASGETVDADSEGITIDKAHGTVELVGTGSGWIVAEVK